MEKSQKKNKQHKAAIFVILGIILVIGVSYAWFKFQVEGEKEINLTGGSIPLEIILSEQDENLELTNSVPVPDKIGKQGKEFTFSIQNNSKTNVTYELKLVDNEEKKSECHDCNFISYDKIRYQLVRKGLDKVETLTTDRKIDEGTLKNGARNKIEYKLKIWLSKEAGDEVKNGVFYGKLELTGTQTSGSSTPFGNPVEDDSGANVPDLGETLIPVVYNEGTTNWEVADIKTKGEWFDYTKQKWANAVIVDPAKYDNTYRGAAKGTQIPMDDILQMYVWIPRYSYTIQGTYGKNESGTSSPGEIDVKFVEKETKDTGKATYSGSDAAEWYTPDAFVLGGKNLSGIWVGKFESGYKGAGSTGDAEKDSSVPSKVVIKPNEYSWRNIKVSNIYNTAKGIVGDSTFGLDASTYDSHAMKNSEWGAVAYLSQNKYGKYGNTDYTGANKEVYKNDSSSYYTGRSSGQPGASGTSSTGAAEYNNLESAGSNAGQKGPGASTTGTIYGVYDMSGGAYEYVMGNYSNNSGSSGFTGNWYTDYKDYIDFYTSDTASSACNSGVCKGHALSETSGWYGDSQNMVNSSNPWFYRGGGYSNTTGAGVFHFNDDDGNYDTFRSFRVVLTLNETA